MATEFVTLRDGSEQSRHLLPPGENSLADYNEALGAPAGSFLIGNRMLPEGIATRAPALDAQPRDFDRDVRIERPDLDEEIQDTRWRNDLPPKRLWKLNPADSTQLRETPTTELGLINVRDLILLGKAAIEEGYAWDMRRTRNDHLFWPAAPYAWLAWKLDDELPILFRNLPPNRIKLPLEFERWKHAITIPPDFPSIDVMRYSVAAWGSARDLYMSVRRATVWERLRRDRVKSILEGTSGTIPRDPQDSEFESFYLEEIASHARGAELSLQRHAELPPEFRIIDPKDDARQILRLIGYQIRHHCRDGLRSRQSSFSPKVA